MFGRLLLIFITVPLLEIWLLVELGKRIGFWPTLFVVFSTGVIGVLLARAQGITVIRRAYRELADGRLPGGALLDSVLIFAAGLLLLIPGLITDTAGFLLLMPGVRRRVREAMKLWLWRRIKRGSIRLYFRR